MKVLATRNLYQPIRQTLTQKTSSIKRLFGASMSNWSGPSLLPTEMVIPGGLSKKEKMYFLLKGKLPKSVYERWVPHTEDYCCQEGDQLVTVAKDDTYIGSILEKPHNFEVVAEDSREGIIESISENVSGSIYSEDLLNSVSPDTAQAMISYEALKNLIGLE